MIELTLTSNQANRRFDRFLQSYLGRAPKSLIHKFLRKKRIKLNGKKALGNEITNIGDKVTFYLAPETIEELLTEKKQPTGNQIEPVDVLYEDENILLANKPAGVLSHSDSSNGNQDTMADRIAAYLYNEADDFSPALCNRLDRNTSGIVACGKNMAALQALNYIFAERLVDKIYLTIVHGRMKIQKGDLRGFIYKDNKANRSYITQSDNGHAVRTEFVCQETFGDFSLLRVKLHTGRSHQIRAHLADIGHPLAGDVKYGGKPVDFNEGRGQLLHCHLLRFKEIENSPLSYLSGKEWTSPLPAAWKVGKT